MTAARTWVIQTGDLFWRENRCGYTRSVLHAGLYTEAEACRQQEIGTRDGRNDRAIPLASFAGQLASMQADLDRLVGALLDEAAQLPAEELEARLVALGRRPGSAS